MASKKKARKRTSTKEGREHGARQTGRRMSGPERETRKLLQTIADMPAPLPDPPIETTFPTLAQAPIRREPIQTTIPDPPQPETMTMTTVRHEKRINTKMLVPKKFKAASVTQYTALYTVVGIITGQKSGESQYGPWLGFVGTFEAARCEDGEVLTAPMALLPDEATMPLLLALAEHGENKAVEFAFKIGVKPADSVKGFEYLVDQLIAPRINDALAGLRDSITTKLPTL